MASYNGHKNWNHWNVSLWINNDEGLYNAARSICRRHRNKDIAAEVIRVLFDDLGHTKTPDGAPYSRSAVRAAISEI